MASTGREWAKGAGLRTPRLVWLLAGLSTADALRLLVITVPFAGFVIHSSLFWDWIVDDAGISFAYARNLSDGYGLVSQPGLQAVEGYSNPLWVVLLAPLMRLGLFDPALTPKLLSLALVAASFALLYHAMALAIGSERDRRQLLAPILPLLLLASNTSFVVWTTSGMENPLFVLEAALLIYLSMRVVIKDDFGPVSALAIGLTAAAAAMTRPDGVVLALALPLLLVLTGRLSISRLRNLATYAAGFALPMAAFLGLRLLYFEELLPNTYHAKGGLSADDLPAKLDQLRTSVLGFTHTEAQWLIIAAVLAGVLLVRRPAMRVAAVFLACSAAGVLLLPPDWMRENRFCSVFVVTFYVVAALEVIHLWQAAAARLPKYGAAAAALAASAVIAFSAGGFVERSLAFSDRPTVPMSTVSDYFGDRFEGYARVLGVSEPSILTLDIGGLVYDSELRVYDLVGLTDKTIARTLRTDEAAFHDYVLEDLRPTFIHTHGLYAVYAALDRDPRFRVLYRPICEQIDPWVSDVWHFYWYSGDYVRWDVAPNDAVVKQMEASCRKDLPYPGN